LRFRAASVGLAAVIVLLACVGLAFRRSGHRNQSGQQAPVVARHPDRDQLVSPAPPAPQAGMNDPKRMATGFQTAAPVRPGGTSHSSTPPPGSGAGKRSGVPPSPTGRPHLPAEAPDDLMVMNDAQASSVRQWATLSTDEWEQIESR